MMLLNTDSKYQMRDITHLARVGLYLLLLVFTIIYQVRNPFFINLNFLIPIYTFLTLSLGINLVLTSLSFKKRNVLSASLKFLLPMDVVLISSLLYFAGLQSSVYLFFYLYLIFITALSHQLKGAITIAAFSSLLFSVVLFFDRELASQTKTFLFLINNISFFVVAVMSGSLAQRLEFLGEEVQNKDKSIKELKNINQLIVENIKSGLLTLDESNKVIQFNKEALGLLENIKIGDTLHAILPEVYETLSSKAVSVYEFTRNNGDKQYLEVLISKIEVQGELKGSIVLVQDVTNRKNQEERSKTQEKLAAVGQLAAGIAHEIRNPLASMSGSVQLLASSFENIDDEQKKLIAITLKETDRLNNLISEFLEFVRPNLPMEDSVSVQKLLEECVELLKLNAHASQTQVVLRTEGLKVIKGNLDKLKQVILNILINSSQASSQKIDIHAFLKDNFIHIEIKDNGAGMKEDVRKKIFEPFYTTKPKGTGLGLAIVHKIIEAHQGTILVESDLGKGSTFKIQIPVT